MNIVLPKEIQYSDSLPALPEAQAIDVSLTPINGNSFGPSQLIQFDLTSRGFIDPSTMYIRYKYALTNTLTESSTIRGTPVYSFFSKLETIIGSTIYESISNYNQVMNMFLNLQMDVAQKYGQQSAYGWSVGVSTVPSLEQLDGRSCVNNEGKSTSTQPNANFSAPLACMISASEKLFPIGMVPNVRIQITTEAISNMFTTTGAPTDYSLTNVELCYTMIDFGGSVNDLVKSMGEKFYIKTSSFENMGLTPYSGSGTSELIVNLRLASIKSLFAHFSGSSVSQCVNGLFDSIDPTRGTGDLQFNVAGNYYPARPVSLLYNKNSVLMELKKAVGALHSDNYNFSINQIEFNSTEVTTTSATTPGKFYFGVNTEKLSTNGALLTGISTQNSPITLRINSSQATTAPININVIALYDALFEIDPMNKQCVVKK